MKKLRFISLICAVAMSASVTANAAWDFDVVDITEHIEPSVSCSFKLNNQNPNFFVYGYNPSMAYGEYTYNYMSFKSFSIDGKKVFDYSYEESEPLENGYSIASFGNLYGLVNIQDEFVLEPIYDNISFIDNKAIIHKKDNGGHFFEIDIFGNILHEFDFDADCVYSFSNGRAVVKRDKMQGVIDENLNFIVPYSDISFAWTAFQDNVIPFNEEINNRTVYGFMNSDGEILSRLTDIDDIYSISPKDKNGFYIAHIYNSAFSGDIFIKSSDFLPLTTYFTSYLLDESEGIILLESIDDKCVIYDIHMNKLTDWYKTCVRLSYSKLWHLSNSHGTGIYISTDTIPIAKGKEFYSLYETDIADTYIACTKTSDDKTFYTVIDKDGNILYELGEIALRFIGEQNLKYIGGTMYAEKGDNRLYALRDFNGTFYSDYLYDVNFMIKNAPENTYGLDIKNIVECKYKQNNTVKYDYYSIDTGEKAAMDNNGTSSVLYISNKYSLADNKMLVVTNENSYIINSSGEIESVINDSAYHDHNRYGIENENFIIFKNGDSSGNNGYSLYNHNGKLLKTIPSSANLFKFTTGGTTFAFEDGDNFTIMDINGNELLNVPQNNFHHCVPFEYGYSILAGNISEYSDYIDASGKSIFDQQYDNIWPVGDSKFVVCDDDKYSLLTATEKYAVVKVNGEVIESDQSAVIRDSRTLVPMRAIIEALGGSAAWNHREQTAYAEINGKTIAFTIGSPYYKIDGEYYPLDVPAQIINDRTMLPVRAISESIGAEVTWNNDARLAQITLN